MFLESVFGSTLSTIKSSKAEGPFILLNGNDSKAIESSYDESSMQADVSHTDIETIKERVANSIAESNTLQNSSNAVSKEVNHESLHENVNVHNVSNISSGSLENLVLTSHRQPLEFRDISGGMLNISRNEHKVIKTSDSELSSTMLNKNSTAKLDTRNKAEVDLAVPNNQNKELHHAKIHHVNEKMPLSQHSMNKELDLYRGYVKLQIRDFRRSKEKALQWLIENKDHDYGWGEETTRALITLWMADYAFEKSGDMAALMSKQLHLKLFTLMSR